MDLSSLNIVDYVVIVVLIGSGILATLRGFMRELLGVIGWILAVILARLAKPMIAEWLEDFIKEESLIDILAWMIPFVVIVLVWFIFANLAAPGLKKMAMGSFDRPLGFIFGAFRGIVIVAVVYMGVLAVTESEESLPQSVLDSASIAPVRVVATAMTGFAPESVQDTVEDAIPPQDIDDIKDGFTTTAEEQLEKAKEAAEETAEDAVDNAGDLLPDEKIIIPESN